MKISPLLTVKDIAERLAVSTSTIYDLAASGKLPSFRIGSRGRGVLRFTEEMVQKFLEENRHEGDEDEDEPLMFIR